MNQVPGWEYGRRNNQSECAHFVCPSLLETASADSWVGDLLNVFWKAGSSLFKAAGSETDTVLNIEMMQTHWRQRVYRCLHTV